MRYIEGWERAKNNDYLSDEYEWVYYTQHYYTKKMDRCRLLIGTQGIYSGSLCISCSGDLIQRTIPVFLDGCETMTFSNEHILSLVPIWITAYILSQ